MGMLESRWKRCHQNRYSVCPYLGDSDTEIKETMSQSILNRNYTHQNGDRQEPSNQTQTATALFQWISFHPRARHRPQYWKMGICSKGYHEQSEPAHLI